MRVRVTPCVCFVFACVRTPWVPRWHPSGAFIYIICSRILGRVRCFASQYAPFVVLYFLPRILRYDAAAAPGAPVGNSGLFASAMNLITNVRGAGASAWQRAWQTSTRKNLGVQWCHGPLCLLYITRGRVWLLAAREQPVNRGLVVSGSVLLCVPKNKLKDYDF